MPTIDSSPTASGIGNVGIVGLGLLGGAIAARLVERGFSVVGYDANESRRDVALNDGVVVVNSAAEVAAKCELVLLSLPTGDISALVVRELAPQLHRGQIIVDTTTAAAEQMIALAGLLTPLGVAFVEAEVAGSSVQVRRGEVLVFVSGDDAVVAKCRPVLEAFAVAVHHAGNTGDAARWKLVHNLLLGLHRAVLAEGLVLAEALGLDASRILEVLKQSPAASAVMTTKGAKMLARDFTPQATVRQHLKDVRLILAAAAACGAETPLSQLHASLLERASELGYAEADNSAIMAAFSRKSS
ncbi:MAG: NAD(P)-dependent oxidoreductase [Planctomycetaceae bacterium]|nr:NAD(P)-dependent oxidoreductase [Planctomycetaceae bacterium]